MRLIDPRTGQVDLFTTPDQVDFLASGVKGHQPVDRKMWFRNSAIDPASRSAQ